MFGAGKIIAAAMAVVSLTPAVASAASLTPLGSVTVRVKGSFSDVISVNCDRTFPATVGAGGVLTVHTNGNTLGAGCTIATFQSDLKLTMGTYNPAGPGSAPFAVTDFNITAVSSCPQGATPISGTWTNGSSATTSGTLPGGCSFNFSISTSPAVTVF